VTDKQNKWSQWLHLAEWWYNSTYHTSAKMTPFQALYGYEPPKWKEFALIDTKVQAVKKQLDEEQKILKILKENLATTRNQMKQQADHHRSEREFKEGDWVFVRLQPYKQLSLKQQGKNKLAPKFYTDLITLGVSGCVLIMCLRCFVIIACACYTLWFKQ
jgi:hypothetical protein